MKYIEQLFILVLKEGPCVGTSLCVPDCFGWLGGAVGGTDWGSCGTMHQDHPSGMAGAEVG